MRDFVIDRQWTTDGVGWPAAAFAVVGNVTGQHTPTKMYAPLFLFVNRMVQSCVTSNTI